MEETTEGRVEREEKERKSGQCLSAQTGGVERSGHHLKSNSRKQERPNVSQLANGSEGDPPIRTMETKKKELSPQFLPEKNIF